MTLTKKMTRSLDHIKEHMETLTEVSVNQKRVNVYEHIVKMVP